jgi:hypothetical protein
MLQPKEKPECLVYFYKHPLGEVLIIGWSFQCDNKG